MSKYFQHQTSLLESSAIPQVLHLQTELGSNAQTKLEMMLDKMEPMKFHEIMPFKNLLMLYGHLESQYDISPQMDILQKKIPASKVFIHCLIQKLISKDSYRCTGPKDAIAAAKGLEIGRRFPESENKLSIPALLLTCSPEEAPPEPLPKTFRKTTSSR